MGKHTSIAKHNNLGLVPEAEGNHLVEYDKPSRQEERGNFWFDLI